MWVRRELVYTARNSYYTGGKRSNRIASENKSTSRGERTEPTVAGSKPTLGKPGNPVRNKGAKVPGGTKVRVDSSVVESQCTKSPGSGTNYTKAMSQRRMLV